MTLLLGILLSLGQSGGPQSAPALPRDRYSVAAPVTLERFRSVFAALDSDGDGKLLWKEAKAAGMTEARFREHDLDGDSVVSRDEFDLSYAAEIRSRGLAPDPKLVARLEALEKIAKEKHWRAPVEKPASAPVGPVNASPDKNPPPTEKVRRRYTPFGPAGPVPRSPTPTPNPTPPAPVPAPRPVVPAPKPVAPPPRPNG